MTITRDLSNRDRAYGAGAIRGEAPNNFFEQLMVGDALANRLEAAMWAPGSHLARSPTMQGVVTAPGQVNAADPRFVNAHRAFRDAFDAVLDPKSLAKLDPARAAQVLSALDAWEAVASGLARGVSQGAEYWGNRDEMKSGSRARHDKLSGVNRGVATKVGPTTFGPLHSTPMSNVERAAMMAARSKDYDVPLPPAAARAVAALGLGPMAPDTAAAYESIASALPPDQTERAPTPSERAGKRASAEQPFHLTDPYAAFPNFRAAPPAADAFFAPNALEQPFHLSDPYAAFPNFRAASPAADALFAPNALGPPSVFEGRLGTDTPIGPDPSRFTPGAPGSNRRGDAAPSVRADIALAPQTADDLPPGSFHGGLPIGAAPSLAQAETLPPPTFDPAARAADLATITSPAPAGLGVFGAAPNGEQMSETRAAGIAQPTPVDLAPGSFHGAVPEIGAIGAATAAPITAAGARATVEAPDIGHLGPPRGPDAAPQLIIGHTDIGPMGRGIAPTFGPGQFDLTGFGLPGSLGDHSVLDEPPDAAQRTQARTTATLAAAAAQQAGASAPAAAGVTGANVTDPAAVQAPNDAPRAAASAPAAEAPPSPGVAAPAEGRAPVADAPRSALPGDAVRPPLSSGMTAPSAFADLASLPTPADYAQLGLNVNDYMHDLAMGMAAPPPGMEGYGARMNDDRYGVAFTQAIHDAIAAQPYGGLADAWGARGTFGKSAPGDYIPDHPTNMWGTNIPGSPHGTDYYGPGGSLVGSLSMGPGGTISGSMGNDTPTGSMSIGSGFDGYGGLGPSNAAADSESGRGFGNTGGMSFGAFGSVGGGDTVGGGFGGSDLGGWSGGPAGNSDNANSDRGGGVDTGPSGDW